MRVLYLHGFLSSPSSYKAKVTAEWLAKHYPDVAYQCPFLSSYPSVAKDQLDRLFSQISGEAYLLGSSLGGFWATYCVEKNYASKAVLINPAVEPHTRFTHYIGEPLKSYYSDDTYVLTMNDLRALEACDHANITDPSKYWLLLQKGDETLDYRLAERKYTSCRQLVEDNGSHSFEGYEMHLDNIMRFFLG